MRSLVKFALLSATALPLAAHASTLDQLSITGVDANNVSYSIDFALDPTVPAGNGYDFSYAGVNGTVNGVSDTFDVTIDPIIGNDYVYLEDSSASFFADFVFDPNGDVSFLSGTPDSGALPIITPGSFSGVTECAASLHMPAAALPGSPMLAMFAVPTLALSCGEAVDLSVTGGSTTTPTSVTPEPSALALFATGTLGIAGVLRRRAQC